MTDPAVHLPRGMLRAAPSMGAKVVNSAGVPMGRIEDVLIDMNDGHVAAVVLSFREFAGMNDKLVAVPLAALSWDATTGHFTLDVTRETLLGAPSFRTGEWPELLDRVRAADVYSTCGFPPYWKE